MADVNKIVSMTRREALCRVTSRGEMAAADLEIGAALTFAGCRHELDCRTGGSMCKMSIDTSEGRKDIWRLGVEARLSVGTVEPLL